MLGLWIGERVVVLSEFEHVNWEAIKIVRNQLLSLERVFHID